MDDILKQVTSKTEMKYGENEASRLLSDAIEEVEPDTKGRHAAAFKLLQQLMELCSQIGIRAQIPQGQGWEKMVQIALGYDRGIAVLLEENGQLLVANADPAQRTRKIKVPLRYDRFTKRLEGQDEDDTVTPRPGEPHPKRSALGVVVEYVLNELPKRVPPST